MSTNYYLKLPAHSKCDHCKREEPAQEIHIGKFTPGWKFGFNPRFKTYNEWYQFLMEDVPGTGYLDAHVGRVNNRILEYIYDEYDKKIPFVDFIEMIEKAQEGLWICDPRNPDEREKALAVQEANAGRPWEFLDATGYRIIAAEEFT